MKVGCVGELVIDFICPEPASSIADASHFVKCPGGSPANVAAMLHQAGIDTTLISRVGKDGFGVFLLDVVASCGLSVGAITKDTRYATRCVFLAHDESGRRSIEIANRNSADQYMEMEQIASSTLDALDLLHVGGTTLLGTQTGEMTLKLVNQVKKSGGRVTFDPNINLRRISEAAMARIRRLLPFIDILKVNEEEWRTMQADFQVTPAMFDVVVCTRGGAGARVITGDVVADVPAEEVDVVDVTGAGDAFFAGFMAYLIKNAGSRFIVTPEQIKPAAEAGSRRASLIIQHIGGALAQCASPMGY